MIIRTLLRLRNCVAHFEAVPSIRVGKSAILNSACHQSTAATATDLDEDDDVDADVDFDSNKLPYISIQDLNFEWESELSEEKRRKFEQVKNEYVIWRNADTMIPDPDAIDRKLWMQVNFFF